jgi:hypothetical protein
MQLQRISGRVCKWFTNHGFIVYGNKQTIFTHKSNYLPGFTPEVGQVVEFEIGPAAMQGKNDEAYRVTVTKTTDEVLREHGLSKLLGQRTVITPESKTVVTLRKDDLQEGA